MASSLDLYRPLRNYVVFTYSEREAQLIEDDLETLKTQAERLHSKQAN
uniref:Uncharacterized protein n=1 Tax=Brassica oleracea TaxID=3712 RepID=A0A3P6FHL2_BRAOL|nr:unnamed protein product [Brassica oleracea]